MRASRLPSLLLLATLALTGCQPAPPDPPAATLRPSVAPPSPTPTPTPLASEASFTPPDPIDAAYVERVLNRLYATEGEVVREIVETRAVSDDAAAQLNEIYTEEYAALVAEAYAGITDEQVQALRDPPGDSTFEVEQVLSASADCLFVSGRRQYRKVQIEPRDRTGEIDFVQLVRDAETSPDNPTGWVVADLRTRPIGTQEEDLCA